MNDINANQMSTVRRKEWCRALNKIPYACVTARDIAMLMNVCKTTSIEILKAAGGISSFDDAEKFMSLGADRLGTSRLVKIVKNTDNGAGY